MAKIKSLLAALLLAIQTNNVSAETLFRYQNYENKTNLESIIKNPTISKTTSGIIPVEFETFQKMGFDYRLLGILSHDLLKSRLNITEPKFRSYKARDSQRIFYVDTIDEHIENDKARLLSFIDMHTDKYKIAVDFNAYPSGSNTAYRAKVYVKPETWYGKLTLKFLCLFDGLVQGRIDDLTKTSKDLFTELRKNPDLIYQTTLSDEEKQKVRAYFK